MVHRVVLWCVCTWGVLWSVAVEGVVYTDTNACVIAARSDDMANLVACLRVASDDVAAATVAAYPGDVNALLPRGVHPLRVAVARELLGTIAAFGTRKDASARPMDQYGCVLLTAASMKSADALRVLLTSGPALDVTCAMDNLILRQGCTALDAAVLSNLPAHLELLIHAGAPVNTPVCDGNPLFQQRMWTNRRYSPFVRDWWEEEEHVARLHALGKTGGVAGSRDAGEA